MAETLKGNVRQKLQSELPPSLTWYIVDYNSWQESEQGLRLTATLDKNVVLAEGMVNIAVRKWWLYRLFLTIAQAIKNSTLTESISRKWVIGEITKTKKLSLMELVESIFLSRPTCTDPVS